jgi:hypothetical protein
LLGAFPIGLLNMSKVFDKLVVVRRFRVVNILIQRFVSW